MTGLVGLIELLHSSLAQATLPHAFGGALALAYAVFEPRATADIDVNVFIPHTDARRAFDVLPEVVAWTEADVARVEREGQVRCWAGITPVDLFLNTNDFHLQAARNVRTVPFGEISIPVLSPNDLAVLKAYYDRSKDWVDLQTMADARSFEPIVVTRWLSDLVGQNDHRIAKLLATVPSDVDDRSVGDPIMNLPAARLAAPAGHPPRH